MNELAPAIVAREVRARSLIEIAGRDLVEIGVLDQPEIPAVLLVGGHTSNGWVADLDGAPRLFLALEFLGEPPFDDVLVVHEAVHLGHLAQGAAGWPETVAEGLFCEGLAVALSRRLRPGLADTAYLWFDEEPQAWVSECASREDEIRAVALEGLEGSDPSLVAQLFSAGRGSALPTRCGYWLGDVILSDVLDAGTSPRDLVALPYADALALVRDRLTD